MQLKRVPLLLLFCVLLMICLELLASVVYVEFLRGVPPTKEQNEACVGITFVAVVCGGIAAAIAAYVNEEW